MGLGHLFEQTVFGFCWFDLPALLILVFVVLYFSMRLRKMKKRQKELEEQLADLYMQDTFPPDDMDMDMLL